MGAAAATGVIGAGMAIGGTALQANAAGQTKRALRRIAETPGLDLEAQTAEARRLQAGTQALESARNRFNADELNAMLERSIPGYAQGQKQRIGNAESLMRGEIPMDVQQQVARGSAAHALEGGYGGSGFGRNLEARDLGLTSLDLMGRGGQQFSGIIGSTPVGPLANYTWSPKEVADWREKDRLNRMAASFAAEQAPGFSMVWGRQLQQAGDQLGGAGGGGGGRSPSAYSGRLGGGGSGSYMNGSGQGGGWGPTDAGGS